jgi:hypothetical protein
MARSRKPPAIAAQQGAYVRSLEYWIYGVAMGVVIGMVIAITALNGWKG